MKRPKFTRSRQSQKSRLQRIEQLLMPPRSEPPEEEEICDEEWLGHFRLYGQNGFFRHEPDFPQALREFEEALQEAKQDPHYLPPPEFMPHASEVRRRRYWRLDTMSVPVQESWLWLTAMYCRVLEGIPAVSLQEWDMLTTWYHAHRQEMARWTIQAVDREMTIPCLDQALEQITARDVEAGKYAAILRQLYARFHRRPHASLSPGSPASSDSPSQELLPAGGPLVPHLCSDPEAVPLE